MEITLQQTHKLSMTVNGRDYAFSIDALSIEEAKKILSRDLRQIVGGLGIQETVEEATAVTDTPKIQSVSGTKL